MPLTPDQIDLLDLKDRQKLTRKEIAKRLGIAESSVRARLERARDANALHGAYHSLSEIRCTTFHRDLGERGLVKWAA